MAIRYRFAVMEHNFSRTLFAALIITYAVAITEVSSFQFYGASALVWMLRLDIALWLLYWVSHNLEKIAFKWNRKRR